MIRISRLLFPAIAALALAPQASPAQSRAEVALAKQVLAGLQRVSIRQNVEYCGYLGYTSGGRLVASEATRGSVAACTATATGLIAEITASYHTHAAYSAAYTGEIPSGDDLNGDAALGINGYVSTPGGRLWFLNTAAMEITQICGFGCLPRDGRFRRGAEGRIAERYSYAQLIRRLGQ